MQAARRLLLILAAVLATGAGPAAASAAPPYPLGPPIASVSTGTVTSRGATVFSGAGFAPHERVRIEADYGSFTVLIRSVEASASGTFRSSVTLSRRGVATLVATGVESGVVVTASVRVVTPTSHSHGGGNGNGAILPTTGSSIHALAGPVYGGLAAVLLGTALLWITRRRRRRAGA